MCKGEKDLFGKLYKGPERPLTPRSFQVVAHRRVGAYALQIDWADGHNDGHLQLRGSEETAGARTSERSVADPVEVGTAEVLAALFETGTTDGLDLPFGPPAERPHLHQVAAGPHRAPLAAVVAGRVVEEEDAVRVAAPADQAQVARAEQVRRGLGDAAQQRDRVRRLRGEARAERAGVALEAQVPVVLGQDEVDRGEAPRRRRRAPARCPSAMWRSVSRKARARSAMRAPSAPSPQRLSASARPRGSRAVRRASASGGSPRSAEQLDGVRPFTTGRVLRKSRRDARRERGTQFSPFYRRRGHAGV